VKGKKEPTQQNVGGREISQQKAVDGIKKENTSMRWEARDVPLAAAGFIITYTCAV